MNRALLASFGLLAACSRGEPPSSTAPDAAAAVPDAASLPSEPRSTLRTDAGLATPSFSRALAEGRAHAHATRWPEAVQAFERALVVEPDNVVALNELGWAALHAGDDTKAKRANEHALDLDPPAAQKAQTLYNEGRRLETLGKLDEARVAYEGSLAARNSEVVQKRLDALGSDAGAPSPLDAGGVAPPARSTHTVPCASLHADEASLRVCLEKAAHSTIRAGSSFFLEPELDVERLPPTLRVLRFGERTALAKQLSSTLLLVARQAQGMLPLAALGVGHEPATGPRTRVTWLGADKQAAGGVWFVRSHQSRLAQELGGLEVKEDSVEYLTVCVLGEGTPTCPVQLPIISRDKLAYPNTSDLDADEQRLVADRIRDVGAPYDRTTQLSPRLDKAGRTLTVTLVTGKESDVPRGVLGLHTLR